MAVVMPPRRQFVLAALPCGHSTWQLYGDFAVIDPTCWIEQTGAQLAPHSVYLWNL